MSSELRIDPLTGLKVILAPSRADRPASFQTAEPHERSREDCPLCEGHESETPPETYALRPKGGAANSGGWLVRVVPNKYPALTPGEPQEAHDHLASDGSEPELFVCTPARGTHELIVHTPGHLTAMSDLAPEQFALAVATWRERLALHASDAAYVHLIVNEGRSAGASLEHTHAQLFALPFVPAAVARERERFTAHNTRTGGGCLLCDLLQEEMRLRKRVVAVNEQAVLLAPYASSMAYQLQLVPRAHALSLAEADTPAVAALLLDGLSRLRRGLESPPPLNLWLRTAPAGAEHFHWHIAIVPRLAQPAGLELGAGVGMNVYPPERVAADLGET